MLRELPSETKTSYFCSYCTLQIWPLKTYNQAILKIKIARSFKLIQLIEDRN